MKIFRLFFATAFALLSALAHAGDTKNSPAGYLDFNFYPYLADVDTDAVFTLNTSAELGRRFSYFSLLALGGRADESEFKDTEWYYTEQNIRWQVSEGSPLDLTVQHNMRSNAADRLRLGFRWRINDSGLLKPYFDAIHFKWSINFHAIQFDDQDGHVWQMEHVWRVTFPYLSDRIYLGGFIDHTMNEDNTGEVSDNPIAAECQLGVRLYENLYAVTEFRYYEYRRSDVNNLAVGVEYKIVW